MLNKNVEEFWHDLSKLKTFEYNFVFPNLTFLYKNMLALPHSNADAERIFSIVTDVRTKKGINCHMKF